MPILPLSRIVFKLGTRTHLPSFQLAINQGTSCPYPSVLFPKINQGTLPLLSWPKKGRNQKQFIFFTQRTEILKKCKYCLPLSVYIGQRTCFSIEGRRWDLIIPRELYERKVGLLNPGLTCTTVRFVDYTMAKEAIEGWNLALPEKPLLSCRSDPLFRHPKLVIPHI